jgi:hypothetical protein
VSAPYWQVTEVAGFQYSQVYPTLFTEKQIFTRSKRGQNLPPIEPRLQQITTVGFQSNSPDYTNGLPSGNLSRQRGVTVKKKEKGTTKDSTTNLVFRFEKIPFFALVDLLFLIHSELPPLP